MGFAAKVKTGANLNPIGASLFGTCTTQASVQAKEATVTGLNSLTNMEGLTIHVYFANANESDDPAPTLTVTDGTFSYGPKAIRRAGNSPAGGTSKTSWNAGSILSLTFYGDEWYITGWLNDDTLYNDATTSVHGLMLATDKSKLDAMSSNVNTIILTNTEVSAILWGNDIEGAGNTARYPDYPKVANITVLDVTPSMAATVIFDPNDIAEYDFAPVVVTDDDTISIFAAVAPESAITIPTIILQTGRSSIGGT